MDLLDRMHRVAFLGPEFLTWLWFRSETGGGEFALDPEWGDFELWFEDKLLVGSVVVNAQENLFKGGHPAASLEARTALRLGKFATDAKLRIVRGAQEWVFGLKASDLVPSGIKLPAVLSKEDDDQFYERMFLLEQLDTMIKGLFGLFLKLRVSKRWLDDELPTIQRWIKGDDVEPTPLDPVALGVKAAEVVAPPPDPGAPVKSWPPLAEVAAALEPVKAAIGAVGEPADPGHRAVPGEPKRGDVVERDDRPGAVVDHDPVPADRMMRRPGGAVGEVDASDAERDPGAHPADPDHAPQGLDADEPALDVPDVSGDDVPPWEAMADGDVPPWASGPDED
ncbi:MAG: hypothetical protein H6705_20155 [Myxococcales bacterium]|nr:hypothetical protein [Myxococcales bacterium]